MRSSKMQRRNYKKFDHINRNVWKQGQTQKLKNEKRKNRKNQVIYMLGHDAEKSNFEGIECLLLHKLKITYMITYIGWLKKTGSRKGMYNYRHVYFIIIDFFFFFWLWLKACRKRALPL